MRLQQLGVLLLQQVQLLVREGALALLLRLAEVQHQPQPRHFALQLTHATRQHLHTNTNEITKTITCMCTLIPLGVCLRKQVRRRRGATRALARVR